MNLVKLMMAAVLLILLAGSGQLSAASDSSARKLDPAAGERTGRAVSEAIRTLHIQTDMPLDLGQPKGRSNTPEAFPALPDLDKSSPWDLSGLRFFFKALFWAAITAVVVILIKAFLENRWSDGQKRDFGPSDVAENGPDPAAGIRLEAARMNADDLARSGDFAEAMHVLLMQSVSEMRRRLSVAIAGSLTSREILQRLKLTPAERAAFGDIVGRVELTYFGGRRPGARDYSACRASFETLSLALRRGAEA